MSTLPALRNASDVIGSPVLAALAAPAGICDLDGQLLRAADNQPAGWLWVAVPENPAHRPRSAA